MKTLDENSFYHHMHIMIVLFLILYVNLLDVVFVCVWTMRQESHTHITDMVTALERRSDESCDMTGRGQEKSSDHRDTCEVVKLSLIVTKL